MYSYQKMAPLFVWALVMFIMVFHPAHASQAIEKTAQTGDKVQQRSLNKPGGTADHSKFSILQQDFKTGSDVTKACLTCHTEAGHQFMKSIHWTWDYTHPVTGQKLGKKRVINGFCGNNPSNEGGCTICHAGYGWKDDTFDFTDQTKIDCLVCHDQTGTYFKTQNSPGHPDWNKIFRSDPPKNFDEIAQSVGMPSRNNCGKCHFNGGGGNGVKHGDLDQSLINPDRSLDVHMDAQGLNFACTACHVGDSHIWAGSRYNTTAIDPKGKGHMPGFRRDIASCESCHGTTPHEKDEILGLKLNSHTDRVACQTCHIPEFSRGGIATKTLWDWSKGGKMKDGKPYSISGYTQGDGKHRHTYASIKGEFEWGENVVPYYDWFDGVMKYSTVETKIDPTKAPIDLNHFEGAPDNRDSRIWPFKRMHTVQAYDTKYNNLVYTHVWGNDDSSYWGNYDWKKAIDEGMKHADVPYSGEFDFVDTYMYWPLAHMVAPKEDALKCGQCHSKDGRLKHLAGFYMPGRDNFQWLDILGAIMLIGAFGLVTVHAAIRIIMRKGEHS